VSVQDHGVGEETPVSADAAAARARLVEATRRLALAVGTTDVDEQVMSTVAAQLDALTPALEPYRLRRAPAPTFAEAVGAPRYHSARYNPGMPELDIVFTDGVARARPVVDDLLQGPRDSVHGGIMAYYMDTLLACLVQQQGHLCVTGSLQVRYRARTPLRRPVEMEARIREVRERTIVVDATVSVDGAVCVEAEAVFVRVDER